MIVSDLGPEELACHLRSGGLTVVMGDYVVRIRSSLPPLARGLALMYADYPLAPQDGFADFPVSLEPGAFPARWLAPRVRFHANGHCPFEPLPPAQALPLLEWGLNWCIANRVLDRLVLHGAVLERGGRALLLPGDPGAGKSTLCAALALSGWRLLSDELILLDPASGRVHALPRPVSLKNGAIPILQEFAPGTVFTEPVPDTRKGTVALMRAPKDSVSRMAESALPVRVVFPRYVAGAATELMPVSRGSAFVRLAGQGFNYGVLGLTGFETLSALVEGCDAHEFRYSRLDEAVALFASLD